MKFYYKYEPKSSDDRAYAEISILDSEGKNHIHPKYGTFLPGRLERDFFTLDIR